MKRKQALAYNATGPTCNYIGTENLNRIMNRCFPGGVSAYNGREVFGGTDYTYKPNRGSFRKLFSLWDEMMNTDLGDDCYRIGSLYENLNKKIEVYCFYGYKITVDYFDENAVIDFVEPVFKDSILEYAFGKFLVAFSYRYQIEIVNNHLLNMFQKPEKLCKNTDLETR